MDVEVTVEAAKRHPAAWPYRAVEMLGLLALVYGLAASAWLIAVGGVMVIGLAYKLYRRRHPTLRGRGGRARFPGAGDTDSFGGDASGSD